ncbi:MAG: hypothetical protein ACHQ51_08800 [Elusimicrobiota bacterium]
MSVVSVLTEEHVLLLRFVGYLGWDEPEGAETPKRVRGDLLAFFCALDRHEEFEETIFGGPAGEAGVLGRLTGVLSEEHRRLAGIRVEILEILRSARENTSPRLKPLVERLAAHLHAHFAWEEKSLWPRRPPSHSVDEEVDLENRARADLLLLSAEVASCGIHLADSAGRGPEVRDSR